MKNNKFKKIKDLYNKQYKCIRYEFEDSGDFTVYLKNFEKEKIDTIEVRDKDEIQKIKSFIDG